jgi:2-hydroxy-3-keto-5-methylthiopentenyl-1-phosphate phosphatase
MAEQKQIERMLNDPAFYILMRSDLDSMNPGKAMAQASHAYAALRKAIKSKLNIQRDFIDWMNTTEQDFGTTIVLSGTERQIDSALDRINRDRLMCSGWVYDPTYPVRDGKVTHLVPVLTCAFVFGERKEIKFLTQHMELHS